MNDELFDVVNEQDEVIRQATRKEVHENSLLHRATFVLFLKNGNAILQKRSEKVEHAPGAFGSTAAGHVLAGETYEDGLFRECSEETGWALNKNNLHFLGKLRHTHLEANSGRVHDVFHGFYVYEFEGELFDLVPDKDEVKELVAFPMAQILHPETIKVPYSFALGEKNTLEALQKYLEVRNA
jgi:isopentenyldiphosphate isomerase